ncbi:MAG: hypothetical protein AAFN77_07180 [Planctomycetota bacterium]
MRTIPQEKQLATASFLQEPPSLLRVVLVLSAIIATLLTLNALMPRAINEGPGNSRISFLIAIWMGLLAGCFSGQLNLISLWTACSIGNIIHRIPWAILFLSLMWSSVVIGYGWGNGIDRGSWLSQRTSEFASLMLILLACGSIATQIPMGIFSWLKRWRLVNRIEVFERSTQHFQIKEMLVSTLVLATAFAAIRISISLTGAELFKGESGISNEVTTCLMSLLAAANLLLVFPCMLFALRNTLRWSHLLLGTIVCVVVSLIELVIACSILGAPGGEYLEVSGLFIAANAGQILVPVVVVLILKYQLGFRLVSLDESADHVLSDDEMAIVSPRPLVNPVSVNDKPDVDEIPDDFFG